MPKISEGAKKLRSVIDKGAKPAEVALALDCTVTTVYTIMSGEGKPSLHVANKAKEAFKIPTEAWESGA
jgi:DNA-binding XRE family transcriptional regulator